MVTRLFWPRHLSIRTIVNAAALYCFVDVSVRNILKILSTSDQFKATQGGLTLAWEKLANLLTPQYDTIRQNIKNSAALHADETGWWIRGKSQWL